MFELLVQKIAAHPRYGPAVADAARRGAPLILNYHSHGNPADFCVSVCAREPNPLQLFGQEDPLFELAHIKGFGRSREECVPLCGPLGAALQAHYALAQPPEIYLNGRPYPASSLPD